MLDELMAYNNGEPIFLSDIHPNWRFIGFIDKNGNITLY